MKIAYIAHPVGGDVELNTLKILEIVREINLNEPDTVPFAPYLADIQAMDDEDPTQRARGMKNNVTYFRRYIVDELRLYGQRISKGMITEIQLAEAYGIPIKPMNETLKRELNKIKPTT